MSQKDKMIKRLLSQPKDYTIDELDTLFNKCGLHKGNRGKTSGSAIEYYDPKTGRVMKIHTPHPGNILKGYMLRAAIDFLKSEGLL